MLRVLCLKPLTPDCVGSCWSQHAPDGSAESSQCALGCSTPAGSSGTYAARAFPDPRFRFVAVRCCVPHQGAAPFRLPFGLWSTRDPHIWMPRYAHISARPVVQRASAIDAILAIAIASKWLDASAGNPLKRTISTGSLSMSMVWTQVSVSMDSLCVSECACHSGQCQ